MRIICVSSFLPLYHFYPGVSPHARLFPPFVFAGFIVVVLLQCWDVALSVRTTHTVSLRDVCVCVVEGVCHSDPIQPRALLICHHNYHIYVPAVDVI